jgi:hypothetical protein
MNINSMRRRAKYMNESMDLISTLIITCIDCIDLSSLATLNTLKVLKILIDLKADKFVPELLNIVISTIERITTIQSR